MTTLRIQRNAKTQHNAKTQCNTKNATEGLNVMETTMPTGIMIKFH